MSDLIENGLPRSRVDRLDSLDHPHSWIQQETEPVRDRLTGQCFPDLQALKDAIRKISFRGGAVADLMARELLNSGVVSIKSPTDDSTLDDPRVAKRGDVTDLQLLPETKTPPDFGKPLPYQSAGKWKINPDGSLTNVWSNERGSGRHFLQDKMREMFSGLLRPAKVFDSWLQNLHRSEHQRYTPDSSRKTREKEAKHPTTQFTSTFCEQGGRSHQEDAYYVSEQDPYWHEQCGNRYTLQIVADGAGGTEGGAVASKTAIDSFVEYLMFQLASLLTRGVSDDSTIQQILWEGVTRAHQAIQQRTQGMTTFSATLVDHQARVIHVAHVGDSQIHLADDKEVRLLVPEHSFVAQQLASGIITPEEALVHPLKNYITSALGGRGSQPDKIFVHSYPYTPGTILVLNTDGAEHLKIVENKPISGIPALLAYAQQHNVALPILLNWIKSGAASNGPDRDNATAIGVSLQ